jgi:hypothetical protein
MKRLDNETFAYKANKIHNHKFCYTGVVYKNNRTAVEILCPIHGIFKQIPSNHLTGYGCPSCGGTKKSSAKEFARKAKIRHSNKFSYGNVQYKTSAEKVSITCKNHGEFLQTPKDHLRGIGCPACGNVKKPSLKEFIDNANKVHQRKFSYSESKYQNSWTKIIITCPTHGNFYQTPDDHLQGYGCPTCRESKGEKVIRYFLLANAIDFQGQYKFSNCKYKNLLRFDFAILCGETVSGLIEFHGEQHYKSVLHFGGENNFKIQTHRDQIKKDFCEANNIPLMIIPYWKKTDIPLLVAEFCRKIRG